MREAIPIVRGLCTESEMIGFEIVELDPLMDPTYRSALNANFIMHACLTGIAMRKQGITDGGYLSELTTEHMQPGAGLEGAAEGRAEETDPEYGRATPR
jgi:guanidinobutyrase